MTYITIVLILVLTLSTTSNSEPNVNVCGSKSSCHECIQTKNCAWCMDPEFSESRCFEPGVSSLTKGCPENYTWNPKSNHHVTLQKALTPGDMGTNRRSDHSDSQTIVQVYPQRVELKLRISSYFCY